jgi:hypothetical protein
MNYIEKQILIVNAITDKQYKSAFELSARYYILHFIDYLLETLDLNIIEKSNALPSAVVYKNHKLLEKLLSAGVKINFNYSIDKYTFIEYNKIKGTKHIFIEDKKTFNILEFYRKLQQ